MVCLQRPVPRWNWYIAVWEVEYMQQTEVYKSKRCCLNMGVRLCIHKKCPRRTFQFWPPRIFRSSVSSLSARSFSRSARSFSHSLSASACFRLTASRSNSHSACFRLSSSCFCLVACHSNSCSASTFAQRSSWAAAAAWALSSLTPMVSYETLDSAKLTK